MLWISEDEVWILLLFDLNTKELRTLQALLINFFAVIIQRHDRFLQHYSEVGRQDTHQYDQLWHGESKNNKLELPGLAYVIPYYYKSLMSVSCIMHTVQAWFCREQHDFYIIRVPPSVITASTVTVLLQVSLPFMRLDRFWVNIQKGASPGPQNAPVKAAKKKTGSW